jgi:hypothetical protein
VGGTAVAAPGPGQPQAAPAPCSYEIARRPATLVAPLRSQSLSTRSKYCIAGLVPGFNYNTSVISEGRGPIRNELDPLPGSEAHIPISRQPNPYAIRYAFEIYMVRTAVGSAQLSIDPLCPSSASSSLESSASGQPASRRKVRFSVFNSEIRRTNGKVRSLSS